MAKVEEEEVAERQVHRKILVEHKIFFFKREKILSNSSDDHFKNSILLVRY